MRSSLVWFAKEMEKVLKENDYKSSINTDKAFHNLISETYELNLALSNVSIFKPKLTPKPFRERAIKEAVDVANYAMIVANRLRE